MNADKCLDQHQYKAMIEAEMISTPGGCTNNSPMTTNPSMSNKNPVKENHPINLYKHWMSSTRLLSGGSVQLRQSVRQ